MEFVKCARCGKGRELGRLKRVNDVEFKHVHISICLKDEGFRKLQERWKRVEEWRKLSERVLQLR